jgi:hypothetical protein
MLAGGDPAGPLRGRLVTQAEHDNRPSLHAFAQHVEMNVLMHLAA